MLERLARNIANLVIKALQMQFILQGHRLTGKLNKSIEERIEVTDFGLKIQILLEPYGIILNRGVPANKIPFSLSRTGNRSSKYIKGLQRFAKLRFFVSDKQALRIAFAIARKHKREGMPTKGSFKFSRTGKRTDAFQEALNDSQKAIDSLIQDALDVTITEILIK